MTYEFDAPLLRLEGKIAWTVLFVPFPVNVDYKTNGRVNVIATLDGHLFPATLLPCRNGHYMAFNNAMKSATGKRLGQTVHVCIAPDQAPRVVEVPEMIGAALAGDRKASVAFEALPAYIRREEIRRVMDAKTEATRERRLTALIAKLNPDAGGRCPSDSSGAPLD